METLAIIAYKQPILKQEIELLRGVDVGGIIRTLMEKGLVKIVGRKDLPGKPLIYGTTNKFLEVFDLKDIKSLPKLKEIKAFGSDDYEPTLTGALKEAVSGFQGNPPENRHETAGTETETEVTTDQESEDNIPEPDQEKDTGDESQRRQEQQQEYQESCEQEEHRDQVQAVTDGQDISREEFRTGTETGNEEDSYLEETGGEIVPDESQDIPEGQPGQELRASGLDRDREEIRREIIAEPSGEESEAGYQEEADREAMDDRNEPERVGQAAQAEETGSPDTGTASEQDTGVSGDEPDWDAAD
jgi:segregation and condensation protein B